MPIMKRNGKANVEMHFLVKTYSGKTVALDVMSNDTVTELKFKIFCKEGVPIHQQCLMFSGRLIQNEEVLGNGQVKHGTMFYLTLPLLGGGPKRKEKKTLEVARQMEEEERGHGCRRGSKLKNEHRHYEERIDVEEEEDLGHMRKGVAVMNTKGLSAPTFNGEASWAAFIEQFGDVAEFAGWSETEKLVRLKTSLRGKAADWLPTVAPEKKRSFKTLIEAMAERFDKDSMYPEEAKFALLQRRQRRGESLVELASDIEHLARVAYGGLGNTEMGIQRLAVGHFVEALDDSQLRLQVRFSKPAEMSDALMRAREVERILEGEKRHRSVRGSSLEADNTHRLDSQN